MNDGWRALWSILGIIVGGAVGFLLTMLVCTMFGWTTPETDTQRTITGYIFGIGGIIAGQLTGGIGYINWSYNRYERRRNAEWEQKIACRTTK